MPTKKHLATVQATAYGYELWMGKPDAIVHATTPDKQRISLILPRAQVDPIAKAIDAGEQPTLIVTATIFEAPSEARRAMR